MVPLSVSLVLGSSFSLFTFVLLPDAGPATADLNAERLVGEVMTMDGSGRCSVE